MTTSDELLSTYLGQTSEVGAEEILRQLLMECAAPLARSVLYSILPREAEDGTQQVLLDLTSRLRRMRHGEEGEIHNFPAYVASTARRTASLLARRSNPARFRLRNRMRYALRTSHALTLWTDAAERAVCGVRRHAGRPADPIAAEYLAQLTPQSGAAAESLIAQMEKLLPSLPGPVLLEEVAMWLSQMEGNAARVESFDEAWTVEGSNLAREMDLRASLAHLWREIGELPPNQRMALLLNLRDQSGDSALRLFPALGIASIRQIAGAMELDANEMALLWPRLPLDDLELAQMLELTRQQVINLRKSARQRLARRSKGR